jgi:hypothetical protein
VRTVLAALALAVLGGGAPAQAATPLARTQFESAVALAGDRIEPGLAPRELGLPPFAITAAYAGDLVAYTLVDSTRRLVVRNWRTGAERAVALPEDSVSLHVRANGTVLVGEDGGGVLEVSPAGVRRRLSRTGTAPVYARRAHRLRLFLGDEGKPVLRRNRRVPLILRCVAAAPPGCRGTLRLSLYVPSRGVTETVRFAIPAGQRRRLTRAASAAALREDRHREDGVALNVRAMAVEPAGRRSVLADGVVVAVG